MSKSMKSDSDIAAALVQYRGNKTAAARKLGISRSAVYRWGKKNAAWLEKPEKRSNVKWVNIDKAIQEISSSSEAGDEKETQELPSIDPLDVWTADKLEVRSTPTGSTRTLVRYERLVPRTIADCLKGFTDKIQWNVPTIQPRLTTGGYVLELSLYDLHLGKYCWAAETGNDYDNDIA